MNTVLAIFSLLLVISPLTSAVLTAVTCSTSGSGLCANVYCNLTPDGKTNYGCGSISTPLNDIMITQIVKVKVLGVYVPLSIFPDFEFCAYYRNTGIGGLTLNNFFSTFVGSLEGQNPGIYHACPYQGSDLQVKNFSIGSVEKFLGFVVSEYTIEYHLWNSNDNNIFTVSMVGNTKTQGILGLNLLN